MKKTLSTLIVLALCFIVEHLASLCNASVAGYVKLQRLARYRQENKRCEGTT